MYVVSTGPDTTAVNDVTHSLYSEAIKRNVGNSISDKDFVFISYIMCFKV